jgi:propanediol dehydratase small subunit
MYDRGHEFDSGLEEDCFELGRTIDLADGNPVRDHSLSARLDDLDDLSLESVLRESVLMSDLVVGNLAMVRFLTVQRNGLENDLNLGMMKNDLS